MAQPQTTVHERGVVEPKPEPGAGDGANYAYWREHGGTWADEYDARKRVSVYYHIQELMLAEYVAAHAAASPGPLCVLEFGCGVGRHLRNLATLPNVDVHGHDQSAAMVGCCERWTSRGWIDEHITLGPPVGRLPHPDGAFDLVYTSEVLVHVRPEHLGAILAELARVSRGQVLHFEPAEQTVIARDAHEGCWRHDLPAGYARLGLACETLASGFRLQSPYRVVRGGPPAYTWPAWKLELLRRLERDIDAGLAQARAAGDEARRRAGEFEAQLAQARTQRNAAQEAAQAAEAASGAAAVERDALRAQLADALRRAADAEKQAERWRAHATGALADHAAKLAEARTRAEVLVREAEVRVADTLAQRGRDVADLAGRLEAERTRAAAGVRELEEAQAMAQRLQRERDAFVRALTRALGHGDPA
jgi:SAM-dependent methyltransferase